MRVGLLLALLLAPTLPCAAETAPRVRGASPKESRLISDLLARSEKARRLVAEIQSTDLIVYVQLTGDLSAGRSATRLAAASEHGRYVWIVLGAMTHPAERGALLARELQHAVEIGRARGVRDERGRRGPSSRIGEDRVKGKGTREKGLQTYSRVFRIFPHPFTWSLEAARVFSRLPNPQAHPQ